MNVRRATEADEPTLRALWEEFERELPFPLEEWRETWVEEWKDIVDDIGAGGAFLAEDDEGPVGVARIELRERGRAHLHLVYVRPRARRAGVAKALLRACVEHARVGGATTVSLNVQTDNAIARAVWRRLGFEELTVALATRLDTLEPRLADDTPRGSYGSTHVQSDDRASIDRALASFLPRLAELDVRSTANGWIRIADPVLDTERRAHARLARELSERLGAVVVALAVEGEAVVRFQLYETGRMVDEYLSVPTYYGLVARGDELALAANPTLVARLTGADRDAVRSVARNALTPAELPPAAHLYDELARLMGLEP